jgi:predicted PurR-regulated permease PerM
MKTVWSRPTKYLFAVGFVLLGIFILHLSRSVIPLLILAALIAVIVRPLTLWLHLRVHLSRGLAVGLVYLCLAILGPLVVILIVPTIIDALVYVGSLDYQSILEGGVAWLRSTLTMIKATQLPVAAFDAYVDRAIDLMLEALQPISPTPAVPLPIDSVLQQLGSALRTAVEAGANPVGRSSRKSQRSYSFSWHPSISAWTHMSIAGRSCRHCRLPTKPKYPPSWPGLG